MANGPPTRPAGSTILPRPCQVPELMMQCLDVVKCLDSWCSAWTSSGAWAHDAVPGPCQVPGLMMQCLDSWCSCNLHQKSTARFFPNDPLCDYSISLGVMRPWPLEGCMRCVCNVPTALHQVMITSLLPCNTSPTLWWKATSPFPAQKCQPPCPLSGKPHHQLQISINIPFTNLNQNSAVKHNQATMDKVLPYPLDSLTKPWSNFLGHRSAMQQRRFVCRSREKAAQDRGSLKVCQPAGNYHPSQRCKCLKRYSKLCRVCKITTHA